MSAPPFGTLNPQPLALLIDDDLSVMTAMRDVIRDIGWRLLPVVSSQEVLTLRDMNSIQFIIMGETTSHLNDMAVVEELGEAGSRAPFIVLEDQNNAHRSDDLGQGARHAGLNYVGRMARSSDMIRLKAALFACQEQVNLKT